MSPVALGRAGRADDTDDGDADDDAGDKDDDSDGAGGENDGARCRWPGGVTELCRRAGLLGRPWAMAGPAPLAIRSGASAPTPPPYLPAAASACENVDRSQSRAGLWCFLIHDIFLMTVSCPHVRRPVLEQHVNRTRKDNDMDKGGGVQYGNGPEE